MTTPQWIMLAILGATLVAFVWNRARHDFVALSALVAATLAGLVPADQALSGFAHPAVGTVAAVLVLGRGLAASGAADWLARRLLPENAGQATTLMTLCGTGAALSGFMNNVGALAIMMPPTLRMTAKVGLAPAAVLMPLAFATVLGGVVTLIGTPPNIIVAGIRADLSGTPFGFFDFTPVGIVLTVAGLAFMALAGRYLLPDRQQGAEVGGTFELAPYLTEVLVDPDGKLAGKSYAALDEALDAAGGEVVAVLRAGRRRALRADDIAMPGDVLLIEADPETLAAILSEHGLQVRAGEKPDAEDGKKPKDRTAPPLTVEAVVPPGSGMVGQSARGMNLRARHGVALAGLSRAGAARHLRLRDMVVRPGDVLLLLGPEERVADFMADMQLLPLADREVNLAPRRAALAASITAASVAATLAGLDPAISFIIGAMAMVAGGVLSGQRAYDALDLPVLVMLAAMLPLAVAMESTGTAERLVALALGAVGEIGPYTALGVILVLTMLLSDILNNAATVALCAPIAAGLASSLGVNADPFLMAVAIGGSCAFLTPIGHQNYVLVMGPGGYRFSDYWRLGLPLEILTAVIAIPLIPVVFPF
jgi:di/tricarboxylate transporter